METLERYRGALLGLATGDALGTTLEFARPGSFTPITDVVGGGPFGLQAGEWTDDTSMALCLAESLVECGVFDPLDQCRRYLRWFRQGHLSVTGECFDIGGTTRAALESFEATENPWSGPTGPDTAGNGSLMRLAPAALAFAGAPDVGERCAESSRTTHGAPEAVEACRFYGTLISEALAGASRESLLSPRPAETPGIAEVAAGSYLRREPPEITGSGYVVRTLEAALWAFSRTRTFQDGALAVVNLGRDADTTGAVYGQLAGAHYGEGGIPASWLEKLAWRDEIRTLADRLLRLRGILRKS